MVVIRQVAIRSDIELWWRNRSVREKFVLVLFLLKMKD